MTAEASLPSEPGYDVVVAETAEPRSTFSPERKFRPIRPPADATTDAAASSGAADGGPPARRALAIGAIESIDHEHILGWAWYRPTPDEPIEVEILVDDAVVLTARADRLRPDLAALGAGNGRHGFLVRNLAQHLSPGPHNIRVRRARDRLDIPGSPKPVIGPEREAEDAAAAPDFTGLTPATAEAGVSGSGADDVAPTADAPVNNVTVRGEAAVPGSAAEPVGVVVRSADAEGAGSPGNATAGPIGNLDRVSFDEISGWVWDAAHPEQPVDIEILDGDVVVLKISADQFRSDLADAGMGTGHHGFAIRNLGGILPLSRHRVRVRRGTDGKDLPRSPMTITRNLLDQGATTFINDVVFSAIEAAARPDDLSQPLGFLLTLLNDVVNAHEALGRTENPAFKSTPAEAVDIMQLTGRTRDLVDQLRYAFQPLYFEPSETPDVSIIIPVHNKFSVTYDCLDSIVKAPSDRTFEIIIADDCSDDETLLAALVFAGAVRIVRNTTNLGFVRTCNAGAALARGRYLFFLNNDTLVKPGWLDELVLTFEQVPNVGIAGSKLLFPDGKLQEAGGIIWRLGDGWNWGRGRDPSDPAFSFLRDADWVSGAALMIERPLFEQLGGFDEYYAPAYYEDTDLAFRVRALGKRVVVQTASEIVHLEGVSAGTDTSGPGMKRFQVVNHAKFYRRWKDTLITHRLNGQQPEMEAERLVRQRAYFIDDSVPTPDQDAGSNAAVEHMRALLALGYKVTFLPADNMTRIDPYTAQLQKLGIECPVHPWFWSVEEVFRKAQHKPDLVYLHRYSNASKYATMVRRYFPECRIVYNVADLHFLRMERQAEIDPTSVSAAQAAAQRRDEIAVMRNVDSVIVHSPVEAKLLAESDAGLKVEVVPWTVRVRPAKLPFAQRSGTAFVGGFGHPPNLDAVRWLVGEIVPRLRPVAPGCTTYLVGSKMPDEVAAMQRPGVVPIGFVPVLADILHKLRCTVVPLRYGAGIKGKVLESFAHGLPCVMSEVAAEGLELSGDLAWLVARTPAEFAEKLARVHEDEAFNRTLADAGLAYIEGRYGAEVVTAALRAAVSG
jgi:GT2 family glycosyltransferase/glycosyltransferase involved in cell wall biosynthesis